MISKEDQLCEWRHYSPRSKGKCPSCGDRHSFTYYVWRGTDDIIDQTFGKCDHESSCGYHSKPWEAPEWKELKTDHNTKVEGKQLPPPPPPPPFMPLPADLVDRSMVMINHENGIGLEYRSSILANYLINLPFMDLEKLAQALIRYYVGTTRSGDTIWWQVDTHGKVHAGKIMKYKPNGHRSKDLLPNGRQDFGTWVHSKLIKAGQLPQDYKLYQCLFGLHLAARPENAGKPVAIVESEKTAMICSIFNDKFIWMACGGLTNLKRSWLEPLIEQNRWITLFPDRDGVTKWHDKKAQLGYDRILIDEFAKTKATAKDPDNADILDITLRLLKEKYDADHSVYATVKRVLHLDSDNEPLQNLINTFKLQIP